MGMRLRSIVSYFVALNHGIICSLFGVFGKPGNEIIIVSSGYAAAGVNNGRQRTALPSRVRGKFLCQRGKCLQSGQKEGRPGRAWVSNSEPGGVVLSFRLLLRKIHLPRQRKAFGCCLPDKKHARGCRACLGLCYSMGRWMGLSSGDNRTVPVSLVRFLDATFQKGSRKPSPCTLKYSQKKLTRSSSKSRISYVESFPQPF